MQKTIWILFAVIVAAGSGGAAYYVIEHQANEPMPSAVERPSLQPDPASKMRDDDVTRRKVEGIGSTRELKPVPVP